MAKKVVKKTVKKKVAKVAPKKRTTVRRSKSTRGVSKVVVILVAALVLVGLGGFYFLSKNGTGSSALPILGTPLNDKCPLNDPDLCKFMNNYKSLENYTMNSQTTENGTKMESMIEVQGQNKSHMVSKENGKENMNLITIGNTTYTKDESDGKWVKTTYNPDNSPMQEATKLKDEFKSDDTQTKDTTQYKNLGKEACGSLMCFKYQIITQDSQGSTEYIWFDDREYKIRKERSESQGNVSEVTFSYDPVSISEPSPIKEGSASDVMMKNNGGGQGMPSQDEINKMMQQYKQSSSGDTQSQPADNSSDSSGGDSSSSDY